MAPTDPDCGIMHAKEDGYGGDATPNFNVQIATQNQYVTNYGAFDQPSDKSIAMDFIDTCIEENSVKPSSVVEDAGYGCEEVYVGLKKRGISAIVKYPNYDAESRRRPVKEGTYDKFGFKLSEDESTLICPAGHRMRVIRTEEEYTRSGFRSDSTVMTCDHCPGCPFKEKCQVAKNKRREIRRKLGNIREERRAKARLDLPANQEKHINDPITILYPRMTSHCKILSTVFAHSKLDFPPHTFPNMEINDVKNRIRTKHLGKRIFVNQLKGSSAGIKSIHIW